MMARTAELMGEAPSPRRETTRPSFEMTRVSFAARGNLRIPKFFASAPSRTSNSLHFQAVQVHLYIDFILAAVGRVWTSTIVQEPWLGECPTTSQCEWLLWVVISGQIIRSNCRVMLSRRPPIGYELQKSMDMGVHMGAVDLGQRTGTPELSQTR